MPNARLTPAYMTRWGPPLWSERAGLYSRVRSDSVSLVLTSPPFALRRQKAYGNVAATGDRLALAVCRRNSPHPSS